MFMKQTKVWLILTIALSLLGLALACSKTPEGTSDNGAPTATGKALEEAQIRNLIDDRLKAVRNKDVNASMSSLAPDVLSFDVLKGRIKPKPTYRATGLISDCTH